MSFQFLRRIKTRIALSFSLLFLIVAVPAIYYAFNQVNLFFGGMYLQQMRDAALMARSLYSYDSHIGPDSLTASISKITASNVFLVSNEGKILFQSIDNSYPEAAVPSSIPILSSNEGQLADGVRHKLMKFDGRKYLFVQTELASGSRLIQIKSFDYVTEIMVQMRNIIFWASFLGLIALIAVAFWVSANITKPLEELTIQANKIRSGDPPGKTSIKSPDEIGDLADALNDIVENLNRARARIGKLETMRRDFFSNIRREIESPVKGIQEDLAEILKSSRVDEQFCRERLEKAQNQAFKLKLLLRALIEISELELGEVSPTIQKAVLKDLMSEMAEQYGSAIANKGLQFEIEYSGLNGDVVVLADSNLIKMVLRSLISNAIDFTDRGFVKIVIKDEAENVGIIVEDSGRGIAPDQVNRIFERFYRVIDSESGSQDRAGLGLAIAQHIMAAHGQNIEVDSTLGVGSRFSFRLKKNPIASTA